MATGGSRCAAGIVVATLAAPLRVGQCQQGERSHRRKADSQVKRPDTRRPRSAVADPSGDPHPRIRRHIAVSYLTRQDRRRTVHIEGSGQRTRCTTLIWRRAIVMLISKVLLTGHRLSSDELQLEGMAPAPLGAKAFPASSQKCTRSAKVPVSRRGDRSSHIDGHAPTAAVRLKAQHP